jgi:RecA-family ATPase
MITLNDFPIELFADYIEGKEPTAKETSLNFNEDGELQEITDYRNNTLYQGACNLHKTFPLDKKLALAIYRAFTEKYCPTLLKEQNGWKEIRTVFKSASKSKNANESRKKQGKGIKEDLCFLDSTEILRLEVAQTKWTVPFIIPKAGIVALCADAGIGKTWFSLYIAVCIVTGRKFLGIDEVEQGPVIYINQEMTFGEIQFRLKELGLPEGAPFYTFKIRDFSLEEYGEELIELAKEIKPVLVVFDSLSRIHSKNENSSQEMNWVTNFFIKMSDLGSAVLSPHHVTKSDNPDYRGSSAIKAAVDLMLFLERKE